MRVSKTLPVFLMSVLAIGCGSGEAEVEEAPEAAAASADAVAPQCVTSADAAALAERPSPLREVALDVGGAGGRLCYGAPSANGREVMGALVPYGEPWRAGANEPTTLHLTYPASLGGVALEPGSYSIYTIPGEDEWEFFVNPNHERWGVPIGDEVRATEIGSFTVTPTPIDEMVETLRYRFESGTDGGMGDIVLEWEHTQVRIHFMPGG